MSQEGEDLFLSTLTVSGCAEFGIFTNLSFACAGSGTLNYYSNVSQEGEDLFVSTLTLSGCAEFGIFANL